MSKTGNSRSAAGAPFCCEDCRCGFNPFCVSNDPPIHLMTAKTSEFAIWAFFWRGCGPKRTSAAYGVPVIAGPAPMAKSTPESGLFFLPSLVFLYCPRTTDDTCVEVQLTENGDDCILQDGGRTCSQRSLTSTIHLLHTHTPSPAPALVQGGRARRTCAVRPRHGARVTNHFPGRRAYHDVRVIIGEIEKPFDGRHADHALRHRRVVLVGCKRQDLVFGCLVASVTRTAALEEDGRARDLHSHQRPDRRDHCISIKPEDKKATYSPALSLTALALTEWRSCASWITWPRQPRDHHARKGEPPPVSLCS